MCFCLDITIFYLSVLYTSRKEVISMNWEVIIIGVPALIAGFAFIGITIGWITFK